MTRPTRDAEGLVLLYVGTMIDAAKLAGVEPHEITHAILDLIGYSWAQNGLSRGEAVEFAAHQIGGGFDFAVATCQAPGGAA